MKRFRRALVEKLEPYNCRMFEPERFRKAYFSNFIQSWNYDPEKLNTFLQGYVARS